MASTAVSATANRSNRVKLINQSVRKQQQQQQQQQEWITGVEGDEEVEEAPGQNDDVVDVEPRRVDDGRVTDA